MKERADVVVIGAGAAGCFAAIQAGIHFPGARIRLLERGARPLAKVKISGGGRCNVTNALSEPAELSRCYPRGERFLKKAFYHFTSSDMKRWLEERGVPLRLYPDGCYFPETNDSGTIIDCFLTELKRLEIAVELQTRVERIAPDKKGWLVYTTEKTIATEKIILTTGGQPKLSGFQLLDGLSVPIISPVPSLFTFNLPSERIRELMGIVQDPVTVRIAGEKWTSEGPLLVTHWGISGPAVLKCSAFGARILEAKNYRATVLVNWTGNLRADDVRVLLENERNSGKMLRNTPLFGIKSRLWNFLLIRAGIPEEARWSETGGKSVNRLVEVLVNDGYSMEGKTTFKEEFVTAGGIDLAHIDVRTMESKSHRGLFFAGEVMDIDGITGGFNFQAAWTTAYIAGKSVLLNETLQP